MQIDVFTHNFCVSKVTPRGRDVCNEFARRFIGFTWQNTGGIYNKVPNKVFASATKDRMEFRFHIHALDDFKEFLMRFYFTDKLVNWIVHPEPKAVKVNIKVRDGWKARDNQIPIINHLVNSPCRIRLAELQTGSGKAQPLNALIKVPGGWKTMGEMQVGTEVMAADGSITKVTAVYPQGEKQIYKFTF